MRSAALIALVLSLLAVGGCDFRTRTYEASGRLIDHAGTPASGVQLIVSGPLYDPDGSRGYAIKDASYLTSDPASTAKESVETDSNGYFHASFVAGNSWSSFWGSPPAAPLLPDVHLWVFRQQQWTLMVVPLDASAQQEKLRTGREVQVGTVTLPPHAQSSNISFEYAASDTTGNVVARGTLMLPATLNGSPFVGHWRLNLTATGSSLRHDAWRVGPQVGEGELHGEFHGDEIEISLTQAVDNEIKLRGKIENGSIRGTWSFWTDAGLSDSGPFDASPIR
jgi:hypothetical protein